MTATSTDAPAHQRTARRVGTHATQVVAALILIQAAMAGRSLFGPWTITAHGIVGNVTFALGVAVAAAFTFGRARRSTIAEAWILVLLLTTQIGLGYSGRTSTDAAAWHIPVGVAAFGLAVHLATRPPTADATSPD